MGDTRASLADDEEFAVNLKEQGQTIDAECAREATLCFFSRTLKQTGGTLWKKKGTVKQIG